MSEIVPVIQVDREAALPFIPRNSIAGQDRKGVLAGKYDDAGAIQAFARHRRANVFAQSDLAEALRKALGHISGGLCYFTAEAKHAQLVDAERILEAALTAFDAQMRSSDDA